MRGIPLVLALGIALAAGPAQAAGKKESAPKPPGSEPIPVSIKGETLVLPNGMTFILVPRQGAPTFTGFIAFKVGGVDSVPGNTGIAHMFEHMAFKGTQHVGTTDWEKERGLLDQLQRAGDDLTLLRATGGSKEKILALEAEVKRLSEEEHRLIVKDEFDRFYGLAGEQMLNASTAVDTTQYFVNLPSNALELWMLLESQRIREPVMREFYSERDVIGQERLMRYENDPLGKLYETFISTAFAASPYRLPTIGYASDIPALTMKGAQDFFHRYYSPSNAVGILVGNFDVAAAKALIARYFATIPRRGDPPPVVTREPAQQAERRASAVFDASPIMLVGFHKPTYPDRADTTLDVVQTILADGLTSRLYRRMVEKEGLVAEVNASNGDPGTRYDNLFVFLLSPNEGVGYDRVERALYEELERLKSEPVPEAELGKAKTRILAGYLRRLNHGIGTALTLSSFQFITGDWKNVERYLGDVLAVTPADIRQAAATYFTASNRTVAQLVKPAGAPPATATKEVQP